MTKDAVDFFHKQEDSKNTSIFNSNRVQAIFYMNIAVLLSVLYHSCTKKALNYPTEDSTLLVQPLDLCIVRTFTLTTLSYF